LMADRDALFAEHHRQLFRYFCRAVGHADAARDLTQDVFVRVTRTAIPVASNGEVNAWLFRIARNLVLDYHRTRRRHPTASSLVDEESQSPSQDVSLAVNEALAALPELDRDVFLMREVAGLSYDEIASACELTLAAVRSRIHRARLQLRDQLAAPISNRQTVAMRRSARQTQGPTHE
jgi:RNA polymerase sigma-70 factor (ECF subfamily)